MRTREGGGILQTPSSTAISTTSGAHLRWRIAVRPAVVVLVAMLAVAWFFRFQIANGFTLAFGDRYDAMIEVAILQHWVNVFGGREAWNVTAYFYPAANTLGYNDGYLGFGIVYAIARAAGASLIAAAEITHAVFKFVGFIGMYLLLARPGGCRMGWSLFGATLFTIADLTLQHANHGQLFTLGFAPWAALLAWRGVEALLADNERRLLGFGVGLAALFALWISTAFYLAWFFAFFALLTCAFAVLLAGAERRRAIGAALWRRRWLVIGIGGAAAIMLTPFLMVYLPKAIETGSHPYASMDGTTLRPLELINPGPTHAIWSPILAGIPGLHTNPDIVFGIAPFLFVVAGIAFAWIWRNARAQVPLFATGVALATCWLLMLRVNDISAWALVHSLVPGAGAIRVVGRFQLILLLPAIMLVTVLLDRMRRGGLAMIAGALLLVEQAAGTTAPVKLDVAEQEEMVAAIPPPPQRCRSFYVRSARAYPYPVYDRANDQTYAHNVDAMVLAGVFARPTLNGFSTFNPPHWDFADPQAADYPGRVRRYAGRFGLKGVCVLDAQRGQIWNAVAWE